MAKRTPHLKKSKDAKERQNYETTTLSDLTSHDVFYTTESNETHRTYGYTNKRKNDNDDYYTTDTYPSRYFQKYGSQRKSDDSYMFDDLTTSAISYEETKRKPRHLTSPQSKSEHVHPRRQSPTKHSHGRHSNSREYDYFSPEDSGVRKRSKLTRSPERHVDYDLENGRENLFGRERSARSPRRSKGYEDYIYEEPEEDYDYDKYFERTRSRGRSPEKHQKQERFGENNGRPKKKREHSPKKRNEYQVFAYEQQRQHEGVFGTKKDLSDRTLLPSEVEVRTHEYPILAFKDNNPGKSGSEMVYLPVIVLDKKSEKAGSQGSALEAIPPGHLGNMQVFAANLQNQQNIFQPFENISSQQTRRSRLEHNPETSSGLRYAGSILGSIFDHAQFSPKPTKEKFSSNIKARDGLKVSNEPFIYQVNADIKSGNENVFGRTMINEELINATDQIEFKEIEDPLQDDYPVTKDYIKVNDNTSEQGRKSTLTQKNISEENRRSTMTKPLGNRADLDPIILFNDRVSQNKADRNSTLAKQSLIKKNMSQAISKDVSQKRTTMESKRGSMAISSHLQPDAALEVKGTTGVTRMSTVNRESGQERTETKRKSTVKSKQPSADRRSKIGSLANTSRVPGVGEVLLEEPDISQGKISVQPDLARQNSRFPSTAVQPDLARQNSRFPSTAGQPDLARQNSRKASTATARDFQSVLNRQDSRAASTATARVPDIAEDQKKSQDAPTQFPKDVFQVDESELGPVEKRKSTIRRTFTGNKNLMVPSNTSIVAMQGTLLDPNIEQNRENDQLRQSSKGKIMGAVSQEQVRESFAATAKTSRAQSVYPPSGQVVEQLTSVVDFEAAEPQESEQKPATLTRTKSKRSFKNFASSLVHFGTKKPSMATKPYITVNPPSPTGSTARPTGHEDGHSLFMESIEPTSTLYRNEQSKDRPSVSQSEKERQRINENKQEQKKLSTVAEKQSKSKMSRLFSRSKSQIRDSDSGDGKGQKKSKVRKSRSQKSILGILRKSKSKINMDKASVTSLAPAPYVPTEGPEDKQMETPEEEELKPVMVEDKPCECFTTYVKQARACGHFFLGTNLHQQVMQILKVL